MQFKLLPEDISQDIREDNLGEFYAHIKKFGFDEMNKFNQMEKEMGAVVSYSEGEASGEISKIFDKSLFEEK